MSKILIVDDHALMRKTIGVFVSNIGYQPIFAVNGMEAISVLQAHPEIVLILLDINMPVMGGMDTLQFIRQNLSGKKDLPVLVISTESDKNLIKQAKSLKASGWITKPVDEAMLKKFVDTILVKK